jgi:AraC-like DNA-binding protein
MNDTTLPRQFSFSTDPLPERDRFPAFCEEVFRHVIGADIARRSPMPFRGGLDVRAAGAVVIADLSLTPTEMTRRSLHLGDGNDAIVVQLWRHGAADAVQGEHETRVRSPQALIIDNARPARIALAGTSRFLALTIPRSTIVGRGPDIARVAGLAPADSPAFRLLHGYLEQALAAPFADRRCADVLGNHLIDLTAYALGAAREARDIGEERGVRTARRSAVLRAIAARSGDPDLTAASVAKLLGVTPRYVHLLLEETGRSFTHHLLERRLEKAGALLRDAGQLARKIADIAAEAGFSDLSYFSRTFRRHYGATPSDVRETARRARIAHS